MLIWGFPDGSVVKRIHLPMQETLVGSLGGEDPLEEEMATHYSILAWEILWTEEPGGLQSMASQRVRPTAQLSRGAYIYIKSGNIYITFYC